ncbi:MAG TPA: undecaprenyl-diphosphatase UppP [Spirochaetia bacterium]|nr:undecaprenyl-diphosphatase UppP [Spirochaetia bacterium]
MTVVQAVVLGAVQGLAEFLPISSSAHLVLVPWFMGWPDPGLTFDVALHMGTLVAVVAYFWRDWLLLLARGLRRPASGEGKLFWLLVAATVPGGIFGYLLEKQAETTFRSPYLIAVMLMAMGLALYLADTRFARYKELSGTGWADGLWIGAAQALAIIPGVSRSGITMAAGRTRNLNREAAARFSFLLSTPIILGAGVLQLRHLAPAALNSAFWAGVVSSALVGFLAIRFLLRYLVNHNFNIFVWYRFLLGITILVIAINR